MPHNKYLKSKITLILAIAVLVFVSISLFTTSRQKEEIAAEIQQLRQEVDRTQRENSELQKLITYLNSSAYIEEIARAELGLKKSDENAAIIPSGDIVNLEQLNTVSNTSQQRKSNPRKWLDYFTKNND